MAIQKTVLTTVYNSFTHGWKLNKWRARQTPKWSATTVLHLADEQKEPLIKLKASGSGRVTPEQHKKPAERCIHLPGRKTKQKHGVRKTAPAVIYMQVMLLADIKNMQIKSLLIGIFKSSSFQCSKVLCRIKFPHKRDCHVGFFKIYGYNFFSTMNNIIRL